MTKIFVVIHGHTSCTDVDELLGYYEGEEADVQAICDAMNSQLDLRRSYRYSCQELKRLASVGDVPLLK